MSTLGLIADICSIASLIVSLVVATTVIRLRQSIQQAGSGNVAAGRDAHVGR